MRGKLMALAVSLTLAFPALAQSSVCPYRQLIESQDSSAPGPRLDTHSTSHTLPEQPLIQNLQEAASALPKTPAREKIIAELVALQQKLQMQMKNAKDRNGNPDFLDDYDYNTAMMRLIQLVQENFPHDRALMARALHEYLILERARSGFSKTAGAQAEANFIAILGPEMPARLAYARQLQARGEQNLGVLTARFYPSRTSARAVGEREALALANGFTPQTHLTPQGEFQPGHLPYFRAGEIMASLMEAGHPVSPAGRQLGIAYLHTVRGLRQAPQSFTAAGGAMDAKKISLLISQLAVTNHVTGGKVEIEAGKEPALAADRLRYLAVSLARVHGANRQDVWAGVRDLYEAEAHLPIESHEVTAMISAKMSINQLITSSLPNDYEHPNRDGERSYRTHEYTPDHFDAQGNLRTTTVGRPVAVRELGYKDWAMVGVIPAGKSANPVFKNYTRIPYWARKLAPPLNSMQWPPPPNPSIPSGALRIIENWNGNSLEAIEVMYRKQDGRLFSFFYRRDANGKWVLSEDFVVDGKVDQEKSVFKCMQCHAHGANMHATYSATPQIPEAAANLAAAHGETDRDTQVIQKTLQEDRAKVPAR